MRKIFALIIVCFAVFLTSCTTTTTTRKQIDVALTDIDKVGQKLSEFLTAENINITGQEVTTNRKDVTNVTLELNITIINGQNIPTNDGEKRALGKSIARVIKEHLEDQNKFEIYRVRFENRFENSFMATSRHKTYTFNSTEL